MLKILNNTTNLISKIIRYNKQNNFIYVDRPRYRLLANDFTKTKTRGLNIPSDGNWKVGYVRAVCFDRRQQCFNLTTSAAKLKTKHITRRNKRLKKTLRPPAADKRRRYQNICQQFVYLIDAFQHFLRLWHQNIETRRRLERYGSAVALDNSHSVGSLTELGTCMSIYI